MRSHHPDPENRRARKALYLRRTRGGLKPIALFAALALIAAGAGAAYVITTKPSKAGSSTAGATDSVQPIAGATAVSYPLSLFADGRARHFEYNSNGVRIRYFILQSADGVVRSAFDACDVCWPAGKGYRQDADAMTCIHCNRRFAASRINEQKGGCNPAPLKRTTQADQLVIQVEDLLQGLVYFDFNAKG
jgi:uncharacterized membrane protein